MCSINNFMRITLYIQIFNVSFYHKFLFVEDSRLAVEILCFYGYFLELHNTKFESWHSFAYDKKNGVLQLTNKKLNRQIII